MGGRFHWNTHPTLLSCLGYDSELGLGRNLLDDEETLVSEIPLLDGAIKNLATTTPENVEFSRSMRRG